MARAKNSVESVQVTLSVTKRVRAYLELLTEEGLHGKNVAETGAALIAERIKELVQQGYLDAPSKISIEE